MSYYRADVEKLREELEALIPGAEFYPRDYGYALDVVVGDLMVVAMQPRRGDIGQPEIRRTAEEVAKRFLEER